tara:strand:+ start:757 stop:1026 length:270 start_codon:yes stop_codon:yes gene_type:complete
MKISESSLRAIIRERLERSFGGAKSQKYEKATTKNMFLDRATSHGGWPAGPSKSAYDSTPVNKQISNYLKSLGLFEGESEDEKDSEGPE